MSEARVKLELAESHLERVLDAWNEPDWADLSIYGLYCLEAAVAAAAASVNIPITKDHYKKASVASSLYEKHGLPDVEDLMRDLNDARKAEAYGDVVAPDLNAEEVAGIIEDYVNRVRALVGDSGERENGE
jgi:hypothetical protein